MHSPSALAEKFLTGLMFQTMYLLITGWNKMTTCCGSSGGTKTVAIVIRGHVMRGVRRVSSVAEELHHQIPTMTA